MKPTTEAALFNVLAVACEVFSSVLTSQKSEKLIKDRDHRRDVSRRVAENRFRDRGRIFVSETELRHEARSVNERIMSDSAYRERIASRE